MEVTGLLRRAPRLLVVAAGLVAMTFGFAGAGRAQSMPDAPQAQYMVKNTLVALNHANITGNYTVLRDLGSLRFRANNTAARLSEVFAAMRQQGIDLSPIVVFEPQFAAQPRLDEEGRLRLVGQFPTRPLRVVFDLAFEPTGSRWAIADILVNAVEWPEEPAEEQEEEQGSTSPQGAPQAPPVQQGQAPPRAGPPVPRARPLQ